MSWLQRLYETYEHASNNPHIQSQEDGLMPFYHVNQNVQIIVTINVKGEFIKAEICRDDNGKVKSHYLAIPATNASANRTSGAVAHPLSDKLQYVAKDFFEFSTNKDDNYPLYEQILSQWCESPFAHPKAQAVLTYVKKGTLVKDLLANDILIADPDEPTKLTYPSQASDYPDSILSALNKNKGVFDQGSAFIAWVVTEQDFDNATDSGVAETWQDKSLAQSWQQFYNTLESNEGFCYITGDTQTLASKHPNRILRSATNAKLISANDLDSFTFRGRFTDDKKSIDQHGLQGANIGAVVTEKAHASLSWLLSRQGKEEAGQAIVSWAISGQETIQPTEDIADKVNFSVEEQIEELNIELNADLEAEADANLIMDFDFLYDNVEDENQDTGFAMPDIPAIDDITDNSDNNLADDDNQLLANHSKTLGKSFADKLNLTLQGYRQKLDAHDQISIITLDSATPGRMAVTYYHESMPDDYIDALQAWHTQFSWYFYYKDKDSGQRKLTIKAPTPKQIAQVAYGTRLSDALKKQVLSQILPCIVDGSKRQIPYALVQLCFKRACNPLNIEHWEWEQAICVACGLFRGYHQRHLTEPRSYTMALQPDYTSRDYLYGRLLAVAEDIESLALYIAGEKRNTTAQRYMQQFANRPFSTWRNIELALKPYENRLKSNRGGYLSNMHKLIDQIMYLFTTEDFNNDSALSGEFLLGYHSQLMQLRLAKQQAKKKNNQADETNSEDEI